MVHYKSQSTKHGLSNGLKHMFHRRRWTEIKNDFRERLKPSVERIDFFSSVGSWFPAPGAATEKVQTEKLRKHNEYY